MAKKAKKSSTKPKPAGDGSPASGRGLKVVEEQRSIQREFDAQDAKATKRSREKGTVQAGARKQPEPPFPTQHKTKPGLESDLDPAPRYDASDYRGSGKLEGMAVIITGGDSGIGRAVAALFAREGADVAVVYLSEDEDASATRQAVESEGRQCITILGDVKDPTFCERAIKTTVKAFGRLDVLVNNAAFQSHTDRLEDVSEAHLQDTLQTSIGRYFHMDRAAIPHLKLGACIINTGSETGLMGQKSLLDDSAAQGAIHAFTMSLATNLLERGIRVNCVAPGPVWTPLNPADQTADDVATFGKECAMGRPAQPGELSSAYVFLASPVTASCICGVVPPVMGGPSG